MGRSTFESLEVCLPGELLKAKENECRLDAAYQIKRRQAHRSAGWNATNWFISDMASSSCTPNSGANTAKAQLHSWKGSGGCSGGAVIQQPLGFSTHVPPQSQLIIGLR